MDKNNKPDPSRSSKSLKTNQKIIISISTLLLLGIIFFVSYHFTSGNTKTGYIDSLYSQKLEVDKINNSAAEAVRDIDKLDTTNNEELQRIISVISKSEASMQGCINSLGEITAPASYSSSYSSFMEGLTLNKKIFTQTNLILKNTKSKDLQKAIDALDEYIEKTKISYDNAKLDKVYVKLPSEILTLWDKVGTYALAAYSDYESKSRLLEQYTEYYNSMDTIIEDFLNEKLDLNTYIDAITNNQITIGEVYVEIDKKLDALNRIKNSYSKLSVPSKTAKQHGGFNDIINGYSSYCEEFKSVLTELEEAGGNPDALMEVSISLDDKDVKLQAINVLYTEYKELYDKDKDLYMNIDNL